MNALFPKQRPAQPILAEPVSRSNKPGWIDAVAVYVFFAAVAVRTMFWTETDITRLFPWYIAGETAYLVLFTIVLWRPPTQRGWVQIYFIVQAALLLGLLSLYSHLDFLTILFILLSYQAALVLKDQDRWIWIGIFLFLTCSSLMIYKGALKGLSLAMTPMAGCIIFSAYTIASHEIENARLKSQTLLKELQEKHQKLQEYVGQVEELASMDERNRLARELHDSVSQTMFGILLNTRSAQIMLKRSPEKLRSQLTQLQSQTLEALAEMRGLINQLRPVEPKNRQDS
jgi:signal transduction histidine kinase